MPEQTPQDDANKKDKKPYEITKVTNQEIVIEIGKNSREATRTYQLTGVNLKELNNYSFTLKLNYKNNPPFIDTVNFTRHRNRQSFINDVKEQLYLSEDILSKDVQTLMNAIGSMQYENIDKLTQEKIQYRKNYEMTDPEKKKAMKILENDHIIKDHLIPDTRRFGHAGDELNKEIVYYAGTSRILNEPMSVLLGGNSSGGKSYLLDSILALFPDDERINLTRMTPKSLSHFSKYEISHQILCVDELSGIDPDALSQVRSMLSRGFISLAYTSIDRLTGRMETLQKEVYGPVAIFTSTTQEESIDDETRNRFLILTIDESPEQTGKVIKSIVYQNTKKGLIARKEKKIIQRKFKAIQKCLKPVEIIIPDNIAKYIHFNNEKISFKRKFNGYISLIRAIALHRQYQKKQYTEKGPGGVFTYILVDKQDIIEANSIITRLYGDCLGELNTVNAKCLNDIIRFCKEQAKGTGLRYWEIEFTRRVIRDYSKWEHMPLRRAFEKLFEMEYIFLVRGGDRSRHHYKLNIEEGSLEGGIKLKLWSPKPRREEKKEDKLIKNYSSDNKKPVNQVKLGQDNPAPMERDVKKTAPMNQDNKKLGHRCGTGSSKSETGSGGVDPVLQDDFFKKEENTPKNSHYDEKFEQNMGLMENFKNKIKTGSLGQHI
jgi:hypothetical protein